MSKQPKPVYVSCEDGDYGDAGNDDDYEDDDGDYSKSPGPPEDDFDSDFGSYPQTSWCRKKTGSPQSNSLQYDSAQLETEPLREIPEAQMGTADPNFPVEVDFASVFKEDVEYNTIYFRFIDSLPPHGANKEGVRVWLKSWFGFTDIFESDIGVDKFLDTIPLTGRDLIIAKNYPLWSYLQSGNQVCQGGDMYDLKIIYAFFSDIQRARVVSAIKRGVPRAQEAYRESMIAKRLLRVANAKEDADMVIKKLAAMSLKEKDKKRDDSGELTTGACSRREAQGSKETPKGLFTMAIKDKDKPPESNPASKPRRSKADRKHARTRPHLQGKKKKQEDKIKLEHLEADD